MLGAMIANTKKGSAGKIRKHDNCLIRQSFYVQIARKNFAVIHGLPLFASLRSQVHGAQSRSRFECHSNVGLARIGCEICKTHANDVKPCRGRSLPCRRRELANSTRAIRWADIPTMIATGPVVINDTRQAGDRSVRGYSIAGLVVGTDDHRLPTDKLCRALTSKRRCSGSIRWRRITTQIVSRESRGSAERPKYGSYRDLLPKQTPKKAHGRFPHPFYLEASIPQCLNSCNRSFCKSWSLPHGPGTLPSSKKIGPISARGQKRRFDRRSVTSGLPRGTDIVRPARLVRFVP